MIQRNTIIRPILSIDPGVKSGVAVVAPGPPIRLIAYYHHRFALKRSRPPSEIIREIFGEFHPRFAVIEDQFHRKNLRTLKILARNAGRWEEACKVTGLEVKWVNPQTWQTAIFKGAGRKREQIVAAYSALAKTETRVADLPVDVAAAYCLGRYAAIAFR